MSGFRSPMTAIHRPRAFGKTPGTALRVAAAVLAVSLILSAPARLGAVEWRSPIERALGFLFANQLRRPLQVKVNGARVVDFAGDWPQFFTLKGAERVRVRDVSPFTVAFI